MGKKKREYRIWNWNLDDTEEKFWEMVSSCLEHQRELYGDKEPALMKPTEVLIQEFSEYCKKCWDDEDAQGSIKRAFIKFVAVQTLEARKLNPKEEITEEEPEEPPLEIIID